MKIFRTLLSPTKRSASFPNRTVGFRSAIRTIRKLCFHLAASLLYGDFSRNHFAPILLVTKRGPSRYKHNCHLLLIMATFATVSIATLLPGPARSRLHNHRQRNLPINQLCFSTTYPLLALSSCQFLTPSLPSTSIRRRPSMLSHPLTSIAPSIRRFNLLWPLFPKRPFYQRN